MGTQMYSGVTSCQAHVTQVDAPGDTRHALRLLTIDSLDSPRLIPPGVEVRYVLVVPENSRWAV